MKEGTRSSPQLDDIPELIYRIQLLLPVKEAACTSILSKSWLSAWSSIPTLRFREAIWSVSKEQRGEVSKVVDRTLIRYLRDNIPIETIDIVIDDDQNQESASFAEQWIPRMATKSCIHEISLEFCLRRTSFTLPKEILSGKNLSKISVSNSGSMMHSVSMARHPVINCMSLHELLLEQVHISEDVLDDILSTCSLLVKVNLFHCRGLKTIKVKNLHRLYELNLATYVGNKTFQLEINDVPNVRSFMFEAKPLHSAFLDMIKSKFHFLESLTLDLEFWKSESFDFTCVSLKRLSLKRHIHLTIDINVYAPNLVFFSFHGKTMPSLSFPANILEKIELILILLRPFIIDESFFLKMRGALSFSRKCDINIKISKFDDIMPSDINVDDLRRRFPFPAINVQQLSFQTLSDYKGLRKRSPFFDALFSICHPKHVVAYGDSKSNHNYFCELMVKEVIRKNNKKGYWRDYLQQVEIRRHGDEKWETLIDNWRSFLDGSASVFDFKLNWR